MTAKLGVSDLCANEILCESNLKFFGFFDIQDDKVSCILLLISNTATLVFDFLTPLGKCETL